MKTRTLRTAALVLLFVLAHAARAESAAAIQQVGEVSGAEEETALLVEATGTSVLLRWTLPGDAFPDADFLIERFGPAGSVERITVSSPMPRSEAVSRGLIEDDEYREFFQTFSRDVLPLPEQRDARDLNRAVLTLATFTRAGWAEVLGTVYEDTDVAPGQSYLYRVTTTVGGAPVLVGEEEVTVEETESLAPITGLEGEADDGGINLRWELPLEGFIVGYRVYRVDPDGVERLLTEDGVFISQREDPESGELRVPDVFLQDAEVEAELTYGYSVVGLSVFGRETPRSEIVEVHFPDPEPVEVPMVSAVDVRDRAIELFWAAPVDERVAAIGVVRTLDPVAEPTLLTPELLPPTATSWLDDSVEGGVSYYYALVTVDAHGRQFGPGSYWATRGVNLAPPSAPSGLSIEPTEESLILSWEAPPEPDIHGYELFIVRDDEAGEALVRVTEEPIAGTRHAFEVPPGTLDELRLVVRALNTSFVEGAFSAPVAGRIIDTVPPARPILDEIHAGEGSVAISWAFTTDPDVAGYRVLRAVQGGDDFAVLREGMAPDETSLVDRDVTQGLLHVYTVEAVDASGNVSERAAPLAATPYRLARPDPPENVRARRLDEGGIHVEWEAPASRGILFHVVERSAAGGRWVQVGDPLLGEVLEFTDPSGRPEHAYRVVAIDTSGNVSRPSEEAAVPE
jgi:fibronectin type 3 domain-containing protein